LSLRVLRVYHSGVVSGWRERDRQLRSLGCDVRLISPRSWNEGGADVDLDSGADDFVVACRTWGRHPYGFVYDPRPIVRELRADAIDVIDVHEEPASLAALELRVLARIFASSVPLVFYGAQNIEKQYPLPFRWIERGSLRRAAGAHCCNSEAARIFRKKGLCGITRVIGLGVDTERFAPRDSARTTGTRVVGYVGRLEARKGLATVLEAIATLDGVRVDVYGDGPERSVLEATALRLGVGDRVRFLGYAPYTALPDIYRSFDMLVVPSRRTPGWVEQFGRVAVEAMASGVPVIAGNNGALPEVVGDAGLLVDADDLSGWRRAIESLRDDATTRARLGAASRDRAERWSWAKIADAQLAFYKDCCAPTRAAVR
jgi:glycosyltransferase involved in cell wall biosynthesis